MTEQGLESRRSGSRALSYFLTLSLEVKRIKTPGFKVATMATN